MWQNDEISPPGDTINVASRMESTGEGKRSEVSEKSFVWKHSMLMNFSSFLFFICWSFDTFFSFSNENSHFGEHESSAGWLWWISHRETRDDRNQSSSFFPYFSSEICIDKVAFASRAKGAWKRSGCLDTRHSMPARDSRLTLRAFSSQFSSPSSCKSFESQKSFLTFWSCFRCREQEYAYDECHQVFCSALEY